jgi:serine/threonine-protein kinase
MNGMLHKQGELIIERYEIIKYIGAGGMQEVYLAQDTVIQRQIALKAPKNPSAKKRFKRSASLSAKINHPNIAKTLDYFETDDSPFLIEEFIKGRDLKKVLTEEFLVIDPYFAARLLHHLSKGIAASHHVGVVHRDLKPSNIMVAEGYDFSKVKITDFGIAKMAEEELAEAAAEGTQTTSQTMLGALPYMSPEMVVNPRDASTPADVWSLGAMFYEVISKKPPFGLGLMAVPNILSGNLPERPLFVGQKIQFRSLANELVEIILVTLQLTESLASGKGGMEPVAT